jgi:dissimilatory sulfite reductase (desulfoviridin) alpha/beta subunit
LAQSFWAPRRISLADEILRFAQDDVLHQLLEGHVQVATISREEIQALKSQAMIAEKGGQRFSVRLGIVGGSMDAAQLQAIARLAEQFGDGSLHFTTRQGVEIPHVPYENLGPLRAALEEAGLRLAAAGKCVRAIIACPGSYCACGLVDTQGLAQRLYARVGARTGLPHKFKIGIAGCLNGCTKPTENDLGILGRAKGFTLFVGGKMGKHPRPADKLPLEFDGEDRLFRAVESVIDWFAAEGVAGERFGATIDRVGREKLVQHLTSLKTENVRFC